MCVTRKNYFQVSKNDFLFFLFVIGPMAIAASYGLARAYSALPFYFANTLFISMIISSAVISWIVLGEKVDKKQFLSLCVLGV